MLDARSVADRIAAASVDGATVDRWSLYMTESRRLSLSIKDREAGNAHAPLSLSEGCGARYLLVWNDGLVSRGSLERRQLDRDLDTALKQARDAAYEDPDASHIRGPAEIPEVALHDAGAAAGAGGDTSCWAPRLAAVRETIDGEALRTWSGSFSASEAESRLLTSAGLDVSGRGSSAGWHVSYNGELGDGHSARNLDSDEEFSERLQRVIGLVRELGKPGPALAGTRPTLLHPSVVESYALSTLLHNLDGSAVSNEESHFHREDFGGDTPKLREDLSLTLDPLRPLRSGSYRFTVEGVPARRFTFVDRGRLTSPVLDLKYAHRLGLEPTPLPYSMEALSLEGPERISLNEALRQADGGVMVMSVLGVHTQDATSGDFSLSAPQTLAIKDGGFAGRVRGTIAGNIFDVLNSADLQLVHLEGDSTPGLLFPCRVEVG